MKPNPFLSQLKQNVLCEKVVPKFGPLMYMCKFLKISKKFFLFSNIFFILKLLLLILLCPSQFSEQELKKKLMGIVSQHPKCHFFLDEVSMSPKTLNLVSRRVSEETFLWVAWQSDKSPDNEALKGTNILSIYFFVVNPPPPNLETIVTQR
jgi:hypothetical protein